MAVQQQRKTVLGKDLEDMLSKAHGSTRRPFTTSPGTVLVQDKALENAKEKTFKSLLRSIVREGKDPGYRVEKDWPHIEKAALNEVSGLAGGYIVPPEFGLQIFQSIEENSILWPRATRIPMDSFTISLPTVDVTGGALGTPPWFGSINFQWGSQAGGQSLNEQEPKFRQVELTAKDLIGQAIASNQLMADIGPAGEACLFRLFGRAAAYAAEYAFFQGIGAQPNQNPGQPLGIINAPATYLLIRNTAGANVKAADIAGMAGHLLPSGWQNAIWVANPSVLPQLFTVAGYFPNMGPDGGTGWAGSLYARPLFISDKLPKLGITGDLLFFDPTLYLIGDRQEVVITASQHPLFQNNQTVIKVWLRADGRPWPDNTITSDDGTTVLAGFVALST